MTSSSTKAVLNCGELARESLQALLKPYQMEVVYVDDNEPLPGSFWGEPEAGLIDNRLYVKNNTPLHSALHEACHYICMDKQRRDKLDTDAGGGYDEENGVCYLQILLAEQLPECGKQRIMDDMDSWGYSFRLGSTQAWFTQDAEDARQWLIQYKLINEQDQPTWKLRE